MTVFSRAVVDTSVGMLDSSNAELQLQGACQVQGQVRKFTKDHLKHDQKNKHLNVCFIQHQKGKSNQHKILIIKLLVYKVQRIHEKHLSSCCCCDCLLTITPGHSGHWHGYHKTVNSDVISNSIHVTSGTVAVDQTKSVHEWPCCIEKTN